MIPHPMTLPKALLLDLDGTILDAYRNPDEAWRALCHEFADRLEPVTPVALWGAIIETRDWFWADPERSRQGRLDLRESRRRIVQASFDRLGVPGSPLVNVIADRYTVIREDSIEPFPGAIDTLERLVEADVRLALLTNGNAGQQRNKIKRFGLEGFFRHIQIEEEFGAGKPDGRAFRHALSALGADVSEAWMVGDDLEYDIQGSQRAGIHAVWVDAAGEGLPEEAPIRPDRTIGSLPELLA